MQSTLDWKYISMALKHISVYAIIITIVEKYTWEFQ